MASVTHIMRQLMECDAHNSGSDLS